MRNRLWWVPVLLMLALVAPANLYPEATGPGLGPGELAGYSDAFDRMRDDLWERSQYTETEKQLANFKLGDISVQQGALIFETRTGAFSKSGLTSRFFLVGDFDIQLEMRFAFLKKAVKMDQSVVFLVLEKDRPVEEADKAMFLMIKKVEGRAGGLMTACQSQGRFKRGSKRELKAFHGTLRFVRQGKTITSFRRHHGASEWIKMNRCTCTDKEVFIGFGLTNFHKERRSIRADVPLSALFEDFKINAAQAIVESEI